MKKYNSHLIISKRSYSLGEIVSLLNINRKTCYRWTKDEGLKTIEKNVNPLLVMGVDLIDFLQRKRAKGKAVLKDDEFFCMKCHRPVKAKIGSEIIIKTGKKIGKDNLEQFKKIGVCEVCETKMNKFLKVYR